MNLIVMQFFSFRKKLKNESGSGAPTHSEQFNFLRLFGYWWIRKLLNKKSAEEEVK